MYWNHEYFDAYVHVPEKIFIVRMFSFAWKKKEEL